MTGGNSLTPDPASAIIRDRRASVGLLGAFGLTGVIGAVALAVEFGNIYSAKVANQSVADASALSTALAYSADPDATRMVLVARDVALAANIPSSGVTATLVTSPRNAAAKAIKVDIRTTQFFHLARVLGFGASTVVTSTAFAEIAGNTACIVALAQTGVGIEMSTSAKINAQGCDVATNAAIEVSTSAEIEAQSVTAGGAITTTTSGAVKTTPVPDKTRQNVANAAQDPYAGSSTVTAELAKVGHVNAAVPPTGVPGGTDFSPPSSQNTYIFDGNTVTRTGDTWYAPAGTYNIKVLKVPKDEKVVFRGTTAVPTNVNVSGGINVTEGHLTIEIGAVKVLGAVSVTGGSSITIGSGRHYFRSLSSTGSGSVITVGEGDLDITHGISVSSSAKIAIGKGAKQIAGIVTVTTSSELTLGDGPLSINGNVDVNSSSKATLGSTSETFIKGSVRASTSSVLNFGAGRYYINGDFGGSTSSTYSGTGVSFFLGGTVNMSTSGDTNLNAPADARSAGIGGILFASTATANTSFSTSNGARLRGAIYLPNSPLSLSTSGTLNGTGDCLMLVVKTLRASTSGQLNTGCPSSSSSGSSGIALVS